MSSGPMHRMDEVLKDLVKDLCCELLKLIPAADP